MKDNIFSSRSGWAILVVSVALVGCQNLGHRELTFIPRDGFLRDSGGNGSRANEKAFAGAISRIWESRFFQNNEIIETEIRNNYYDIFDRNSPLASSESKGRGCFLRREGQKDALLLHADLFDHFEISAEGEIVHKSFNKKALAILVHEFAHDFWSNILDDRRRFLFTLESTEFLAEALMAKTKKEKLDFLRRAGVGAPQEQDFRPYKELLTHLRDYPERVAFGNELYASLADLAFLGRIVIPLQLKKFYYGIVSGEVLEKTPG